MVKLSLVCLEKVFKRRPRGFLDSLRLTVKAGTGGNGLPKFGGVGGQGGDIVVTAKEGLSLSAVIRQYPTKRVTAGHGGNSSSKRILGEPGTPAVIEVPVGVTVIKEDGYKKYDLNEDGAKAVVARGGVGGSEKTAYLGLKGKSHIIRLDLRLIADIGLVGFPNAGKSTLLKAVSRAKPKIASYPFTTIRPNIGVMEYSDLRSITMADLPGLIEGAHANIGMGHQFLKHVERTKLLLLIADINGFQLNHKHNHRSCLETIVLLNKELELYKSELLDKPAVLLINKMDTEGADKKFDEIKYKVKDLSAALNDVSEDIRPERPIIFDEVIPISAKNGGSNIQMVKDRLRHILDINDDLERIKQEELENAKKTTRIAR